MGGSNVALRPAPASPPPGYPAQADTRGRGAQGRHGRVSKLVVKDPARRSEGERRKEGRKGSSVAGSSLDNTRHLLDESDPAAGYLLGTTG
ncbi:hypothetical protein E2C01_101111 [Portunus trituberculatus]|uniref:Uncharacterized protein n=1 Tax=Portunus trituberculatus TaxID=210409 RepID=A0A5B7K8Q5_PORTR|nr:hypothetical protein [Portunus trituberculatus]